MKGLQPDQIFILLYNYKIAYVLFGGQFFHKIHLYVTIELLMY
jgi:hypothetical protein